jgi:hypothetical protein
VDNPTVAYSTKLHTPVTEVLRGKEDAASVNEATFALVVDAGIVMVLPVKAGLKVVNSVPVIGVPA